MVEKIRETVEYRVRRNHLFTLGNLIKRMLGNGWSVIRCWQGHDGEHISFERQFNSSPM